MKYSKNLYIFIKIICIILLAIALYSISLFYNKRQKIEKYNSNSNINIVLVLIDNFQEYILINIKQLIKLGHKNIYVITNQQFFTKFDEYIDKIKLINCDDLKDSYDYNNKGNLSNRFFILTSLRIFYLYEFMKQYNIENVIHLENDVLIYYNCEIIKDKFTNNMYMPFISLDMNVLSIVYIPNHTIFKTILDNYDFSVTDMLNFKIIMEKTHLIKQLPIFINNNKDEYNKDEFNFVTENYDIFNFIFDGAAIGQYLGGIDPIHRSNTVGYVNDTCIIKYNKYEFVFDIIDNIKRPFIIIDNNKIPIFNLHIHCKDLKKFVD